MGLLLALVLILSLGACKKDEPKDETSEPVSFTVTFDSGGVGKIPSQTVEGGSLLSEPPLLEKEGYIFGGWVEEWVGVWDFSEHLVSRDMTLCASWLSADAVFSYELLGDTVCITGLKQTVDRIGIPSVINGFAVSEIGEGVFAELSSAKVSSITIPKSVTTIGDSAFRNASSVIITFEEGSALSFVGEDAFLGCNGLSAVSFSEQMTELSVGSFSGTSLRSVTLPSGVSVIPESIFDGCASLGMITMSGNVTTVEDSAFFGCSSLATVLLYGTEEQADALLAEGIAHRNEAFSEATFYLYSEREPAESGAYGFWHFDENQTVKIW